MELILAPHEILQTPVDEFDVKKYHPPTIANEMIALMYKHKGIGLSANQVGLNAQIFVMQTTHNKNYGNPLVVINPIIKAVSKETSLMVEGCLSHPGLQLNVKRPSSCAAEFYTFASDDPNALVRVQTVFEGIDARVFLHEFDHLSGIQFVDRVGSVKLKLAQTRKNKRIKNG